MKSTIKKMAQRFTSLMLAISLFLPATSFAQSDSIDQIKMKKAKLLQEELAKANQKLEDTIESTSKIKQTMFVGISLGTGTISYLLAEQMISKYFQNKPAYESFLNSPSFLDLSDLEILMTEHRLRKYLRIRYGVGSHSIDREGLSRFTGLNRLFDLLEKNVTSTPPRNIGAASIPGTIPDFFKWFLTNVEAGKMQFGSNGFIQAIQCIGLAAHPEKFMVSEVFRNLTDAVETHGMDAVRKVVFTEADAMLFQPENYAPFKRVMLQNAAMFEGNTDYVELAKELRKSGVKGFHLDLVEAHEKNYAQRVLQADKDYKAATRPAAIKRIGISVGIGLVVAAAVYYFVMPLVDKTLITEKYNLSITDMMAMVQNDPEMYNMLLIESPQFRNEMADFSDYLKNTTRKTQNDLNYFDQLTEKNKI